MTVLYLGVIAPPNLSIVTEWCDRGSLNEYLKRNRSIGIKQRAKWIMQVALGMMHLHSENIIHRDLAARNVGLKIEYVDCFLTKLDTSDRKFDR